MPKIIKTKDGDVFAIKLKDGLYAYGQLIAKGTTSDCIIAFDFFTPMVVNDISLIVRSPILFLYHTVDVEIVRGRWMLIGNAPPRKDIRLPEYKTKTLYGFKVLSHNGQTLRDANPSEIEQLSFMDSYAPRMLEKALTAKQGLGEWKPWMEEIVYNT